MGASRFAPSDIFMLAEGDLFAVDETGGVVRCRPAPKGYPPGPCGTATWLAIAGKCTPRTGG
jgi:hypothetical protein